MGLNDAPDQNPGRKKLVIRLIGSLISIALLVYLLYTQGWAEITSAAGRVTLRNIVLAFLLVTMSRIATSGRWHMILKGLDVRIPFSHTISLTFAGLFAANFMPTTVGGDVARLAGAMQMKYDGAKCAASLVLDRMVSLLGMLAAVPFGFHALATSVMTPAFGSVLPLAVIIGQKKLRRSFGWTHKSTLKVVSALGQGVKRPRCMLCALVFTWLHMVFLFSAMTVMLSGMGKDVSFVLVAGLWSIVYLLTLLPISINGYGVQELSATYVFTHAAGLSPTAAVTIVVLVRVLTVAATIPGALCLPSVAGFRGRQRGD